MDEFEMPKPLEVGVQISRGIHSQVSKKALYEELRKYLGEAFRKLAIRKESRIEEGHLMPDHEHMLIRIPPKYAVSQVIGFIKGKSAIHLARVYGGAETELCGSTLLGKRILCIEGGKG